MHKSMLMLENSSTTQKWGFLLFLVLVLVFLKGFYNKLFTGLKNIPGPVIASCTDLWRFRLVRGWQAQYTQRKLHKQYGDVVRLGPRCVSINNWEAIKKIYGSGSAFTKSDFYPTLQNVVHGRIVENLFDTTDAKLHQRNRRLISGSYSMSSMVQLEPMVDSTMKVFLNQLQKRYVETKEVCTFHVWLQYFAFDVVGEITFSKRFGFVETGSDVEGIMAAITWVLKYFAVIGQIPWLDHILIKNPIFRGLAALGILSSENPVYLFSQKQMKSKLSGLDENNEKVGATKGRDFLTQFMDNRHKDPEYMTDENILLNANMNVFAGSDTTGITLTAVFYYLLKNPRVYTRLMKELDNLEVKNEDGLVSWAESRDLEYLGAVINEALRIHPAIGLVLERVVPAGGTTVCGHFIPPGTIIGANAWVFHMRDDIFGDHPEEFRPERWLKENQPALQDKSPGAPEMKNALFSFGLGARTCIGKNISLLEIYKLVPTLLRKYQVRLADPNESWTMENYWLVKQGNLKVYLEPRDL